MSLRDWWPGLNWNFNRKYRKCRIIFIFASVQNWPGLGHKYFSLHRSWEGRKYSLNLLLFRWKGSKKKLLVGRILWRRRDVRCLTQQNNINIGTQSIILLLRLTKLCTDPWKRGKRVLMRRYADVMWSASGLGTIIILFDVRWDAARSHCWYRNIIWASSQIYLYLELLCFE